MGIEGLAIFPGVAAGIALVVLFLTSLKELSRALRAGAAALVLLAATFCVLYVVVHATEAAGLRGTGESLYLAVFGGTILGGLALGKKKLGFSPRELVLMGLIAAFGCMALILLYLGLTIKI